MSTHRQRLLLVSLALATIGAAACRGGTSAATTGPGRGEGCLAPAPLQAHAYQVGHDGGGEARPFGVDANVACADHRCALELGRDDVRGRHELAVEAESGDVYLERADIDGDGVPELIATIDAMLTTYPTGFAPAPDAGSLDAAPGPDDELSEGDLGMSELYRVVIVLDEATLAARWQGPWGVAPPEPEGQACESAVELRDDDCDGRREVMHQVYTCDISLCDQYNAGEVRFEDLDEVAQGYCGAPTVETHDFVAATARGVFVARSR